MKRLVYPLKYIISEMYSTVGLLEIWFIVMILKYFLYYKSLIYSNVVYFFGPIQTLDLKKYISKCLLELSMCLELAQTTRHLNARYLPQFLCHLSHENQTHSYLQTYGLLFSRPPCCDIIWRYNCLVEVIMDWAQSSFWSTSECWSEVGERAVSSVGQAQREGEANSPIWPHHGSLLDIQLSGRCGR